jgi:DNA-directed RNA polymerase subunit RPC12/RpoP
LIADGGLEIRSTKRECSQCGDVFFDRESTDDASRCPDCRPIPDGGEKLPWCDECDAYAVPTESGRCGDCGSMVVYTDGSRDSDDQTSALEELVEETRIQNALLLEMIQIQVQDNAGWDPSDHSLATDVVDSYGDLYGGSIPGWEFDPIAQQVDKMGDHE